MSSKSMTIGQKKEVTPELGDPFFQQLFHLSPDPAWIIEGLNFVECNDAAIKALGYTSRFELLNVHPSKLSPSHQPDGEESFIKADRMMSIALEKGIHRFEWLHTKSDGTNFDAEVTLSRIDLEGRVILYCVWRDISERKKAELARQKAEQKLIEMANTDSLTGLTNRGRFFSLAKREVSRSLRYTKALSILMLDADNFKSINDGHGHSAGDEALKLLAAVCKETFRDVDIVGRIGGEEFAVLLPETTRSMAVEAAERLRKGIDGSKLVFPSDAHFKFTISIGVASLVSSADTLEALLYRADAALYEAKKLGRNRVCVV